MSTEVSGYDNNNTSGVYEEGVKQRSHHHSSSSSISPSQHRDSSKISGTRMKPSRELYRPPANGTNNQLNPSAKEFAPLQMSKSFDFANKERYPVTSGPQDNIVLNRTGLTITFGGSNKQQGHGLTKSRSISSQMTLSPNVLSPTEFCEGRGYKQHHTSGGDNNRQFSFTGPPEMSGQSGSVIQRNHNNHNINNHRDSRQSHYISGSIPGTPVTGPCGPDLMALNDWRTQINVSSFAFPQEIVTTISKAMDDPNRVPGRSLMELVKQIINKVITGAGRNSSGGHKDAPSLPEQAAMLCTGIIQHEDRKTFQESLINTCQEIYHERERILRQDITRWNSYISFLNHMYGKLKRRQLLYVERGEGIAPRFVLLSLLAECCTCTLTSNLQFISEVETMFGVLTTIGRDLEAEMPGRMTLLVTCLREAFLNYRLSPQVSKLLLQLIELEAAGWALPAQAVMYYYPGST